MLYFLKTGFFRNRKNTLEIKFFKSLIKVPFEASDN